MRPHAPAVKRTIFLLQLVLILLIASCAPVEDPLGPLTSLKKTDSAFADLTLCVVISDTTRASFKKMAELDQLYQNLNFGLHSDLDRNHIAAVLSQVLSPRFKSFTVVESTGDPAAQACDACMLLDIVVKVPEIGELVHVTTVSVEGSFINGRGATVGKVSGKNARNIPFGSAKFLFVETCNAAFAEFAKNLDSADSIAAAITGNSQHADAAGSRSGTKGIYALEREIDFNVLDNVAYDPETGQLTLVGHKDARYPARPIPYLQHLAALLEHSRPEFSLTWTPDSEKRINALLQNFESETGPFSIESRRRMAPQIAQVFDARGDVTPGGKALLASMGLRPTINGNAPGSLGVAVKDANEGIVQVTQVLKDSAAERAGIAVGDIMLYLDSYECFTTPVFIRDVRRMGAGAKCHLTFIHFPEGRKSVDITLDQAGGDPWAGLTRNEYAACIFRAAGNDRAAEVTSWLETFHQMMNTPYAKQCLNRLFEVSGCYDEIDGYRRQLQAGQITSQQFAAKGLRALCDALDNCYAGRGAVAQKFNAGLGAGAQQAFTNTDDVLERVRKEALSAALDRVMRNPSGIQVAPEVLAATLHVAPEMTPEYTDVDKRSQLAGLMLEADYLGKRLINEPGLDRKIPQYKTEFAYRRSNRNHADAERMWISVDRVNLAQSPDGFTLAIRNADMRFNVRQIGPDHRDRDTGPDAYGNLLTSIYDDLAREYPCLHELRECAKLAAAAEWLQSKKPGLRLPDRGRVAWSSPSKLKGLMFMYLYPAGGDNRYDTTFVAMGGVRLRPFDRDAGRLPLPNDAALPNLRDHALTQSPYIDVGPGSARAGENPRPLGWIRKSRINGADATAVSIATGEDLRDVPADVEVVDNTLERARVLWRSGALDEAAKILRERIARAQSPQDKAKLLVLFASVLKEKGDAPAALAAIKEAATLDPGSPALLIFQARLALENGKLDEAKNLLRDAVRADPKNQALRDLLVNLETGRSDTIGPPRVLKTAMHGAIGTLGPDETASGQARQGFDTGNLPGPGGKFQKSNGPALHRHPDKKIPDAVRNSDPYKKLEQRRDEAEAKADELAKEEDKLTRAADKAQDPEIKQIVLEKLQDVKKEHAAKDKEAAAAEDDMLDLSFKWENGSTAQPARGEKGNSR